MKQLLKIVNTWWEGELKQCEKYEWNLVDFSHPEKILVHFCYKKSTNICAVSQPSCVFQTNSLNDHTPLHCSINTIQFTVPLYLTTSDSRCLTWRRLWLTAQGRSWSQQWRLTDDRLNQGLPGWGDGGEAQGCQGWWEICRAWSRRGLLGCCCGNTWAGLNIGDPDRGKESYYSFKFFISFSLLF